MSKTIEDLKNYIPFNEQEEKDKKFFIDCEKKEQILTRDNELCHLTSSSIILNKNWDKMLCIYHNIYNSWVFTGGHADGDDDMLYVAKKEAEEETSLRNIKIVSKDPIAIDSLPVLGHVKRGKYVPSHTHLNFTYLFEADENAEIKIKLDENKGIAWIPLDEFLDKTSEEWMKRVFIKVLKKIKIMKK